MRNCVTLLRALRIKVGKPGVPAIFALFLLVGACNSRKDIQAEKFTGLYTPALQISAQAKIFHSQPDSSLLFLKINTKNLLYRSPPGEPATAYVEVVVNIIPLTENTPADSLQITLFDADNNKSEKDLLWTSELPLQEGGRYKILATITDVNNGRSRILEMTVDKSDSSDTGYFLVIQDNKPVFGDRLTAGEKYELLLPEVQKCYGRYYNRKFPPPAPPFSPYEPPLFDYSADSTFSWSGDSVYHFTAPVTGFLHLQNDPTQKKGLTLFVTNPEFPEVKTVESLLPPLRYLLSSREYEQLRVAADKKLAMEEFWKTWAGSDDKARKCIETYFQRVEMANRQFSSFVPGWKSDRGMIYIIFGPPNSVFKSKHVESWVYGEENNSLSLTFNFVKVINPFTENDFRLDRQELYKPVWYRAVESWRSGRPT